MCALFNNSLLHFIKGRERERPSAFACLFTPPFPSPLLLATLLFFALRSRYGCPLGLNRQGKLKRRRGGGELHDRETRPENSLLVSQSALSPLFSSPQLHGTLHRGTGTINKEQYRNRTVLCAIPQKKHMRAIYRLEKGDFYI